MNNRLVTLRAHLYPRIAFVVVANGIGTFVAAKAQAQNTLQTTTKPASTVMAIHSSSDKERFKTAISLDIQAKKLRYAGDVKAALSMYREALLTYDGFSDPHEGIADCLTDQGHYGAAIKEYRIAIGNSSLPKNEVSLKLAIALAKLGQYEEAIVMYRVGLRLPVASGYLSGALLGDEVGESYEQSRQRDRSSVAPVLDIGFDPQAFDSRLFEAAARTAIGTALNLHGHEDMGFVEYNKALQLQPNFAPAFLQRGIAYLLQHKDDLGIADLKRAVNIGSPETCSTAQRWLDHTHVTVVGQVRVPSETQMP